MSNIFYTANGRQINLENFGDTQTTPPNSSTDDIFNKSLKDVVSFVPGGNGKMQLKLDNGLKTKMIATDNGIIMGNISGSAAGTKGPMIFANDGDKSLILGAASGSIGIMGTTIIDGDVIITGHTINKGTIKASKYLNADGSTLSGLPKNVSFDTNGNMIFNGTIKASKYLNEDGSEMKSSSSGCCIN